MEQEQRENLAITQSADVMKGIIRSLIDGLDKREHALNSEIESLQKNREQYEAMLSLLDVGFPIDDQRALHTSAYYKTNEVPEQ